MTDVHANEPLNTSGTTIEPATPEAPKPEPWTPAKVTEWNAYYDLYVAVGVLLLAFLGSANKINQASIWSQLHVGRTISQSLAPTATDRLSYTEEGHRWVNIPWLADVVHYQVFRLVSSFAPVDPNSQVNSNAPEIIEARKTQAATAEQWGAAGLIALDALVRAITVLVLLSIRHKGPGLWWSAVCATLALGVVYGPTGIIVGGVSGPAIVGPESWGQLFLAIELLLLFRAYGQGRAGALNGLIPLFLIWANFDESFFVGLVIQGAALIGAMLVRRRAKGEPAVPMRRGAIALGASVGVCLLNPSFHLIFAAAIGSIAPIVGWVSGPLTADQLSYFGKELNSQKSAELLSLQGYFFALVALGFASFVLNRRRFSLSRFLGYALTAILWALMNRFRLEFSLVLAATLALNGQEWYLGQFGTEGRLGRGWAVWSIGGRAVTIVLVFLVIAKAVTGWNIQYGEPQFGFGFNPADFTFEAAEALRDAPIEGNVLNTQLSQGDAIIWRAAPKRKTFLDSRRHVFSAPTIQKFVEVRNAIRDGEVDLWKSLLEGYGVSAIMIQVTESPKTYQALMVSKDWIPFYDDGSVAMFGRADAPAADLAYFQGHKLDADRLAYKDPSPVPSTDKLPRATTDLDKIYQSRGVTRAQPHSEASLRWLSPVDAPVNAPYLPDPAHCLMAIREARIALAHDTDDTTAYRRLATAYRMLLLEESALLAGVKPTQDNISIILQVSPQAGLLTSRFHQLITALNYAIQTTPPPQVPEARRELANLHLTLAQYYASQGYIDLARDRLQSAIDLSDANDFTPEQFVALTKQLNDFNARLSEVQTRVMNLSVEAQAGPVQKAGAARQMGAVGLAISELEEAAQAGMSLGVVKPTLLDLYCQIGQPDKALDLWTAGNSADPVLADGPGTAALRQGRVFFLLGNYSSAILLWTKEALPQLKLQRALKAPAATRSLIEGDPMATARSLIELPDEVTKQALWEFDVALACLESGQPTDVTAEHFTNALVLTPDLTVRPVIAYYLEKLGKPVPADPNATKTPAAKPAIPIPAAIPLPGPATK